MAEGQRVPAEVTGKTFLIGEQADLLHLDNLFATATYMEGESLIVEASSKKPLYYKCGLFCEIVKSGTKKVRFRDFPIQAKPTWLEISRHGCRNCSGSLGEATVCGELTQWD